jgi:hypothetical protein
MSMPAHGDIHRSCGRYKRSVVQVASRHVLWFKLPAGTSCDAAGSAGWCAQQLLAIAAMAFTTDSSNASRTALAACSRAQHKQHSDMPGQHVPSAHISTMQLAALLT